MNYFLGVTLSIIFATSLVSQTSIETIRDNYFKVNTEEIDLDDFEEILNKTTSSSSVEIDGYKTMLLFLKAKDYFNPLSKLESFNKGKKALEELIKSNPINVELRFLRLTIQDHSPSFLGYNDNIESDEKFISSQLESVKDKDIVNRIRLYLKEGRD